MEQLYEVKNPTSEDISIQFKGVFYTLPADGELKNLSEEVKKFWNNLHEFLYFTKQKSNVKPEPIKEEVKEEVVSLEEKLDELKEEVKEVIEEKEEEVKVGIKAKKGK